ncbi:D-alanine--D-alanine ligase [Bradyrhizobium sp. USDA 4451]
MTILNVALVFGGGPVELDMSMTSAKCVYEALDRKRYCPILVRVARDGKWWLLEHSREFPSRVEPSGTQLMFLPGGGGNALVYRDSGDVTTIHVDVVFPISPYGCSGLLEAAQVPFVGSRGPAPWICSDKQIAKQTLRGAGLPIARSLVLVAGENVTFQCAQKALCSRALFVKPATLHSSIGVSKVTRESEFQAAVQLAFSYDGKVLVEEHVKARELECGILQDVDPPNDLLCSWPSEIIPIDESSFFTSQAKLDGNGVRIHIKSELNEADVDRVRALSREAFRAVGCEALARVDVFLRPDGELLINEIGSAPILRPSSMFARMMKETGLTYSNLVHKLLENAIVRAQRAKRAL